MDRQDSQTAIEQVLEPTPVAPVNRDGPTPRSSENAARAARFRTYATVGPLIILLFLWFWGFRAEGAFRGGPDGRSFEGDYAMFVSAAHILQQGGNPYDTKLLYQEERARLDRQHLRLVKNTAVIRVGNPPLLFWAMQPLTSARYQPAALAWGMFLLLATIIGFVGVLIYARWTAFVLPTVLFLLFPQSYLGAYYGNVVPLVFAGVGLALATVRTYPVVAGGLLTLTLLKPPVALFIALLVFLVHPKQRTSLVAGFSGTLAALILLTLATAGWHSALWWAQGLVGYANNIQSTPDVVSLGGLYVRWASHSLRTIIQGVSLLAALLVTYLWWVKNRRTENADPYSFALLWLTWSLAAPYAHFYDQVLLAVPLVILLGHNGQRIGWKWSAISLYLLFVSAMVISAEPFRILLLPFPLLGIAACVLRARSNPRYREVSLARN